MNEETLKKMLKVLFENGDIKIKVEQKDRYENRYLITTVTIDGEKVFEEESDGVDSGWRDF